MTDHKDPQLHVEEREGKEEEKGSLQGGVTTELQTGKYEKKPKKYYSVSRRGKGWG